MGKQSFDISLYSFFEFALQDIRKNSWRLLDIYGAANSDILSKVQFGSKEYKNAMDWFLNNKIHVVMQHRPDTVKMPCISIALNSSTESTSQAGIGDEFGSYVPDNLISLDERFRSVQAVKVYKDFTPDAYVKEKGIVTMPQDLDTYSIGPGFHMLVENKTGKSYIINRVLDSKNFQIAVNAEIDLVNCYITPIEEAFIVHRKRTRFRESYEIGVHAASQPVEAIWLSQLVEYIFLAYKDYMQLYCRNMENSTFRASNVARNQHYQGDEVFTRFFTLDFEAEMTWIHEINTRIGRVAGGLVIADGPKSPAELSEYIKTQYFVMEGDKEDK